jgi:hypothetical protein
MTADCDHDFNYKIDFWCNGPLEIACDKVAIPVEAADFSLRTGMNFAGQKKIEEKFRK